MDEPELGARVARLEGEVSALRIAVVALARVTPGNHLDEILSGDPEARHGIQPEQLAAFSAVVRSLLEPRR